MSKREELLSKLDNLYAEQKSKNFVNHLIKAYCSLDNIDKVIDKLENVETCSLTNKKITSFGEVSVLESDDIIKQTFNNTLTSLISGNVDTIPLSKEYKGKVVGFTANETTTYLSYEAVSALYEWINTKAKEGDKYIKSILYHTRPKTNSIDNRGNRKPTSTLGDLPALQKLKRDMEKKGL